MSEENTGWTEENSRFFIEYARYFVPDRETQIRALCSLIPDPGGPFSVLELACGEGILAGAILEKFPACTLHGLDGSQEMLNAARRRLDAFGDRFQPGKFDLASGDWRQAQKSFQAVVSSLAIHHLDGPGKAQLFRDVYALLAAGGALLIADVIRPNSPRSMTYTADAYDEVVRQQSLAAGGSLRIFEHFQQEQWNLFRYPDDPIDRPSPLFDQLKWMEEAGFRGVDVFWLKAGHAIFGGYK